MHCMGNARCMLQSTFPQRSSTSSEAFISFIQSCRGSLILPAFPEDAATFAVSAVMFHNFTLPWTKGSHSSAGACQLRNDKRISLLSVWLVTSTSNKKEKSGGRCLCFSPLNLLVRCSYSAFHQRRLMKGSWTVWCENIGNLCPSSLLFDKVQRVTL